MGVVHQASAESLKIELRWSFGLQAEACTSQSRPLHRTSTPRPIRLKASVFRTTAAMPILGLGFGFTSTPELPSIIP